MGDQLALPDGYAELLTELKAEVRSAQHRTRLKVNEEVLTLYWRVDNEVVRFSANRAAHCSEQNPIVASRHRTVMAQRCFPLLGRRRSPARHGAQAIDAGSGCGRQTHRFVRV